MRVAASATSEASTNEFAAGFGREGAKAGLATKEGRADGVPVIDAMDVDTSG